MKEWVNVRVTLLPVDRVPPPHVNPHPSPQSQALTLIQQPIEGRQSRPDSGSQQPTAWHTYLFEGSRWHLRSQTFQPGLGVISREREHPLG